MPSIRMYARPDVYEDIDFDVQFDLSEALRKEVASAFNTDVSHVEVLWISQEYVTANAAPLAVEVMYSVLPSQNLDEKARIALAERLSSLAVEFEGLPKEISEATAWVLPQHDAIFRTAKRQT